MAVIAAWAGMVRSGDVGELGALLAEDVIWEAPDPSLRCNGRDEVVARLRGRGRRPTRVTRIDAAEEDDRVIVTVESPDLPETEWLPAGAPRTIVFTFREGRVVRMQSLTERPQGDCGSLGGR